MAYSPIIMGFAGLACIVVVGGVAWLIEDAIRQRQRRQGKRPISKRDVT